MRASGHKSEASIGSYSCRLCDPKKREISDCLGGLLGSHQRENKEDNTLKDLTVEELDTIFNDNVFFRSYHKSREIAEVPEPHATACKFSELEFITKQCEYNGYQHLSISY